MSFFPLSLLAVESVIVLIVINNLCSSNAMLVHIGLGCLSKDIALIVPILSAVVAEASFGSLKAFFPLPV
jgi:hypothetical protein